MRTSLSALALPALAEDETVIPFLEPQKINPERPMVQWDQLKSWVTPTKEFFAVAHYGYPETKAEGWTLDIGGLVERPRTYPLADLMKRPRKEFTATAAVPSPGSHDNRNQSGYRHTVLD